MGDYINVVETFETKGIELTVFTDFTSSMSYGYGQI